MATNRFNSAYARQLARWLLRALSPDVTFFFGNSDGSILNYGNDDIAAFLGLPANPPRLGPRVIRDKMNGLLAELEATTLPICLPRRAEAGFDELAQYFGLAAVEAALVRFLACARTEVLIAGLQRLAWDAIADDPARYFSRVLAMPLQEVADALLPEGRLFNSGLLDSGSMEWSAKTTPVFGAIVLAHQIMLECPILAIAHPLSNLWMMSDACFNGLRVPPFLPDRFHQMQENPDWPDVRFPN
jgi:hypothetical protein